MVDFFFFKESSQTLGGLCVRDASEANVYNPSQAGEGVGNKANAGRGRVRQVRGCILLLGNA